MSAALDYLVCALLLSGGFFALVGAFGLMKLPDVFLRLHGPTKASTLGVGGVLLATMLWQAMLGEPSLRELLVTLFLFLTAPVSAHMMAKAALSLDHTLRPDPPATEDEPG
jgi:multicomponent K+:H+ antiporter subunit G